MADHTLPLRFPEAAARCQLSGQQLLLFEQPDLDEDRHLLMTLRDGDQSRTLVTTRPAGQAPELVA